MAHRDKPRFPAPAFPDESDQKLLGIYRQRQDEFVLQRVRIPGGRISAAQLRALAAAAREAGARPALHLTTRQGIEIHGLLPETVPGIQRAIAAAGLTTVGAAGDTVRNSTVDPLGGLVPGRVDLLPLAQAVESALRGLDGMWSLPRKFKISYSGDPSGSMRPWMSDVGVVANRDDSFSAIVAGSLGAKPGSGVHFADELTAGDVAALVLAAVRLHADLGDRERRGSARLRHVRERLGDGPFLEVLHERWAEERAKASTVIPASATTVAALDAPVHVRLAVPHGDIPLGAAEALAEAVGRAGIELRLGIEHDLHTFGLHPEDLPNGVQGWVAPRRIVACPGTALCSKAAGPTHEAAEALSAVADAHPGLVFALSGCPNSCSHAAVAGVGITARMKRVADERVAVFRVVMGGEAGAGPGLAEVVAADVPLGELVQTIEDALEARAHAGGGDDV